MSVLFGCGFFLNDRMRRQEFKDRLGREILVLDGAMGSMLQGHLAPGKAPEELNLLKPGIVQAVHENYVEAGADIIITNTLGGSRIKLDEFHLGHLVHDINFQAVKIARLAAGDRVLVACSVGPSGKFLEPLGRLTFDEALENFYEQAQALTEAAPDLIILETMSDIREARAALIAVREVFPGPVIALMTFADGFNTVTGTDAATAVTVYQALGADVIGANCSTGPEEILNVLTVMAEQTDLPLCVEPNAGIPFFKRGKTVYPASPEYMADYAEKFARLGVNIIGGCCGTTPGHIRRIAGRIKPLKPVSRSIPRQTRLASRDRTVTIQDGKPTIIIGERINPTGRKKLAAELAAGQTDLLRQEAVRQVKAGAQILDINVGAPGVDEVEMMGKAVEFVQRAVSVPLSLDSSNPSVLEAGLKEIEGKALINSVTGEEKSLRSILPLAKKYGAAVIGLTLDEGGVPATAQERLKIARRILKRALREGIAKEDIFIDTLTLAVSTDPTMGQETLKALRLVKGKLGVKTVLGVSNISFGLPQRSLINVQFLGMALSHGLDVPILNPYDERIQGTLTGSDVLLGRDLGATNFISRFGNLEFKEKSVPAEKNEKPVDKRLFDAILYGDKNSIENLVKEALDGGKSPISLNQEVLIPALNEVGRRYDAKEYFLPQVILSAEAMQLAFSLIKEHLDFVESRSKGRIVFATVKGDVHDIGKNIVIAVLESYGYPVIDLGKNVETGRIVQVAMARRAQLIGLSALMTTTMMEMGNVVKLVQKKKCPARVMVGGAVVTPRFARQIGAHGYAKDAMEAVKVVKELIG